MSKCLVEQVNALPGEDTLILNLGDSPEMMFLRLGVITEIAKVMRKQSKMPGVERKGCTAEIDPNNYAQCV